MLSDVGRDVGLYNQWILYFPIINLSNLSSAFVLLIQLGKLYPEYGSLNFIHTAVVTLHFVDVFHIAAIIGHHTHQ